MLKRFFSYYRPHRRLFVLDFTCAVLSGLLELVFPLAVKAFVDKLLPSQNWGLILGATAALLGIYFLNTGLQFIVNYWGHVLGISIETEMRRKIFDHLQKLSFRFFRQPEDRSRLVARITKDLEDVGEVAHHGPEDAFIAVMTFLGSFCADVYLIHPKLALDYRARRSAHDLDLDTLWPGDDARPCEPSSDGWGISTHGSKRTLAASGSCRRLQTKNHERVPFCARTTNGTVKQSWMRTGLMSKSMSLSYMTMRIMTAASS